MPKDAICMRPLKISSFIYTVCRVFHWQTIGTALSNGDATVALCDMTYKDRLLFIIVDLFIDSFTIDKIALHPVLACRYKTNIRRKGFVFRSLHRVRTLLSGRLFSKGTHEEHVSR